MYPYHFVNRVKTKYDTSANSLFNDTSLDSVACIMPKSIKEQTDELGSCNLHLGNLLKLFKKINL